MKILVIGGCGFIGSHVVDALLAVVHLHWERVARKFPPDSAGGRTVDNTVKDERGYSTMYPDAAEHGGLTIDLLTL